MSFWKKNSVQYSLWALLSLGAVVLLVFAVKTQRMSTIQSLKVKIDYENGMYFVKESEIEKSINTLLKDSLLFISFQNLPIDSIERELEKNPYISNVEVYSNIMGSLIVRVKQRSPVLRVINKHGVSFYIDDNAQTMPLSSNFTARVPVASGNIDFSNANDSNATDSQKEQLFDLVQFIRANSFWKAQIEQIYINKDNDLELVPKLENHVFLLGSTENLEEKFRRMNIFYKEVLKNQKSDQFKIINVKFKNQIICSKT